MTITEFLLARIAEDEADARQAADDLPSGSWRVGAPGDCGCCDRVESEPGAFGLVAFIDDRISPHIARQNPARVLAECEAKRRIVERCGYVGLGFPARHLAEGVLSLLALPYARHPDYDEAWRP